MIIRDLYRYHLWAMSHPRPWLQWVVVGMVVIDCLMAHIALCLGHLPIFSLISAIVSMSTGYHYLHRTQDKARP